MLYIFPAVVFHIHVLFQTTAQTIETYLCAGVANKTCMFNFCLPLKSSSISDRFLHKTYLLLDTHIWMSGSLNALMKFFQLKRLLSCSTFAKHALGTKFSWKLCKKMPCWCCTVSDRTTICRRVENFSITGLVQDRN